jgi:hypothetical protein
VQNLTALEQSANDLDSITTSDQLILRAEKRQIRHAL